MYVVHVASRCGWTTEILNQCTRKLKKHRNTNSVQLSELDGLSVLNVSLKLNGERNGNYKYACIDLKMKLIGMGGIYNVDILILM